MVTNGAEKHAVIFEDRPLSLRDGAFLIVEFSATGGVRYARTANREEQVGEGLEAEFTTFKQVDNASLVKLSRSIINRAYHIMDRLAVSTPLGYFADRASERMLRDELGEVQEAARQFNDMAAAVRSARRVRIDVYALRVREDDEEAARRLAGAVRERLQDLRDTLAAGDREGFERAIDRARNLDRLATGIQADSIRLAMDAAKEQKAIMLERLRSGAGELAGEGLDLSALDAAISLFQEAVDAGA